MDQGLFRAFGWVVTNLEPCSTHVVAVVNDRHQVGQLVDLPGATTHRPWTLLARCVLVATAQKPPVRVPKHPKQPVGGSWYVWVQSVGLQISDRASGSPNHIYRNLRKEF